MRDDLPTIRATQRARKATALGMLGTCLTAAVGAIVHLVAIQRADAEKAQITGTNAAELAELVAIHAEVRTLSERVTSIETDRKIEAALRAAEKHK